MAHFAQLDETNKVINVIVIANKDTSDNNGIENEEVGIAFCKSLYGEDTRWVQTSYNASFRGIFAGINCSYDPINDAFLPDTNASFDDKPFDEESTND